MKHFRKLALPVYCLAAILILFAVMELAQATWPPRPKELAWRVVAAGLLSRTLVTPILGLVFAFAGALILEQRRVLRTLAGVNVALCLVLVIGLVVFGMDAVQMRTIVGPNSRTAYDLALMLSMSKFAIGLVFLVVLTASEWRAASILSRGAGHSATTTMPFMRHSTRQPAFSGSEPAAAPSDAGRTHKIGDEPRGGRPI
jgi:hypothetical protein